jgi:serine/threonine-protein kinase
MPIAPGATFERYAIESLVGRGGMGEVYRALDTRLHRPVALKVLRPDKEDNATEGPARLLREARSAAALNHANSVSIYELGEAEGIPYIAMEFVTGRSLKTFVRDDSITVATKLDWLEAAARALWAAHRAGLVHRDVKPSNIMISDEGVVKVLDFGLAKPVVKDPATFQTVQGQVLGTPRYMAPEQLAGKPCDARSDQFAFGLTAYELFSGVYAGGPLAGNIKPLDEIAPGVSKALAAAIARMLAREPADRFPTMEAAANALRASQAEPPSSGAPPSSRTVPLGKPPPSSPISNKTLPLATSAPALPDAPVDSSRTNTTVRRDRGKRAFLLLFVCGVAAIALGVAAALLAR